MITEEQIVNVLKQIIDPEIGINIYDLGLIYDLLLSEEQVKVIMTLTTPGCPMHSTMPKWVENALANLDNSKKIIVDLVWQPPWSPSMMSDDAKEQLGYN